MRQKFMIVAVVGLGAAAALAAPAAQAQTPATAVPASATPYSDSRLCKTNDFSYNDGVVEYYLTYRTRWNQYVGSTLYGVYSWQQEEYVGMVSLGTTYFTQLCPPF